MKTYNYSATQKLFKKASQVIPCGIYGHYSPAPLVPATDYPFFTSKAKGSRIWDVDGNEFIDYMCAYGPMVTGYCNPRVDAAAQKQAKLCNCVTGAPPVMVELAEYMTGLITNADWAFFAKNGGDVTNYAVMIAKAETGRKKILMISGGYHGVSAWMQGDGHHGVTDDDRKSVIAVKWNDIEAFRKTLAENRGEIACFIATPYHHPTFADNEFPAAGYWKEIESLCRKEGIVIITDDIRTGFRLHMGGSDEYFGYKSDLTCFCKALANGYPISALTGTEEMKSAASKVFYTGSYWFSAVPMAAAIANLKEMKRINAPKIMIETGKKLLDGMVRIAAGYNYELKTSGSPSMPFLRITNDPSLMLHQDWCGECTKRGAYFTSHHNWFISTAHTDKDIKRTWDIVDDAFKTIKKKYGDNY